MSSTAIVVAMYHGPMGLHSERALDACLREDTKVYRIFSSCRSSIERKREQKQKTLYQQSFQECFIGTNGEPVAADIFYHPLPFDELTSIVKIKRKHYITNQCACMKLVIYVPVSVSPSPPSLQEIIVSV